MPSRSQPPYLHPVPIEPGECLPSWLLRIAARYTPNFQRFSTIWLSDRLRVTPGFDAFPAVSLLMQLGAIPPDELDHYITHHTLLGTTKCFYTEEEWKDLIHTHSMAAAVDELPPRPLAPRNGPESAGDLPSTPAPSDPAPLR